MGTDKNGNRYYENRAEQYGRDRWVVYNTGADLMDYDPATIPSEWHGWLHHMHDKLPEKLEKPFFATDPSFDPVMKTGRDTKVPPAAPTSPTVRVAAHPLMRYPQHQGLKRLCGPWRSTKTRIRSSATNWGATSEPTEQRQHRVAGDRARLRRRRFRIRASLRLRRSARVRRFVGISPTTSDGNCCDCQARRCPAASSTGGGKEPLH